MLIGILVGAGIFRVTSEATAATGPSVILAHLALLSGWLKLISYLGACAYLADALALNLMELLQPGGAHAEDRHRR